MSKDFKIYREIVYMKEHECFGCIKEDKYGVPVKWSKFERRQRKESHYWDNEKKQCHNCKWLDLRNNTKNDYVLEDIKKRIDNLIHLLIKEQIITQKQLGKYYNERNS